MKIILSNDEIVVACCEYAIKSRGEAGKWKATAHIFTTVRGGVAEVIANVELEPLPEDAKIDRAIYSK